MGRPDKITLSGRVYVKYIDDTSRAEHGDVLLYLNDDAVNTFPGDYDNLTDSGYIKAKTFDGGFWHHIDIGEFCMHRENKFGKKQRGLDSAMLCKHIMEACKGLLVRKTYRGHFVRVEEEI